MEEPMKTLDGGMTIQVILFVPKINVIWMTDPFEA